VQDPSAPLSLAIGSKASVIPAGAGRRSATVTLDAGETGNIVVRLQSATPCTFKRVKLEVGSYATPWVGEPLDVEDLRCRRYYQRLAATGGTATSLAVFGQRVGSNALQVPYTIPVPMQAPPALVTSGFAWAPNTPVGNQVAFFDNAGGAWVTITGALTVTTANPTSPSGLVLRLQAATAFGGAAGAVGHFFLGNGAFIALQAEL
jgi:hypothetical protein